MKLLAIIVLVAAMVSCKSDNRLAKIRASSAETMNEMGGSFPTDPESWTSDLPFVELAFQSADKVCACVDMACAQAMMDEFSKKTSDIVRSASSDEMEAMQTPAEKRKVKTAGDEAVFCMTQMIKATRNP